MIGRSFTRGEDEPLLRGEGRFTEDMAPHNAVHLVFLRSTVAAGRITRLDAALARALPGVLAVIDAQTLVAHGVGPFPSPVLPNHLAPGLLHVPAFPCLAGPEILHVGQPILAIVAHTVEVAMDAVELVELDIVDRDTVTDLATAPGGPAVWSDAPDNRIFRVEMGDATATQAAMAQGAHCVTRRLCINRVTAAPMEPRGAVGYWDAVTGRYALVTGTQASHRLAEGVRATMNLPPDGLRVVSGNCGGSFGMRNGALPEYPPILLAARLTGRPVRWIETRSEAFLADPQAREQIVDATLALDESGQFLGLSLEVITGIGAFAGPASLMASFNNLPSAAGVYRFPAIHAVVEGLHLNTQTASAYRGAGRPEAAYIIERMIDIAALQTGMDRIALRRRNMLSPKDLPHRTPLGFVYDTGNFSAVLDHALAVSDWAGFARRRTQSEAKGRLRGIGLACTIEIAGGPASPTPEFAAVTLSGDDCIVRLGSGDAGQGHATAFAQIAADALGLEMTRIRVVSGDTDQVPKGTGSFGSRSMGAAGSALLGACTDVITTLKQHVAVRFEAKVEDIDFTDGLFLQPGTNNTISLESLLAETDLTVAAERWEATKGPSFPNGCHVAEVEIDLDTGALTLCSYLAVEDIGRVINPLLTAGQLHGGIAQGVGQAVMEAVRYDPESGQLLSGSLMDYALPRADDLPFFQTVSLPVHTASNSLGTKGAGEAGTVGALPTLASAVADALAPFGIEDVTMPATPFQIWSAIQSAKA